MTLKLLDLFCGEGGASRGYHLAGFQVTGVDTFTELTQDRYPYPSYKTDAVEFLKNLSDKGSDEFDVIHASPPCQHATQGTISHRNAGKEYPELITPIRALLQEGNRPYIIENVRGAELIKPTELCGCMFNLTALDDDGTQLHLQRARLFETNWSLRPPRPCDHSQHRGDNHKVAGSYGYARRDKALTDRFHGGYVPSKLVQQELMGIKWMTQKGMYQAIPPAYTRYIGHELKFSLTTETQN